MRNNKKCDVGEAKDQTWISWDAEFRPEVERMQLGMCALSLQVGITCVVQFVPANDVQRTTFRIARIDRRATVFFGAEDQISIIVHRRPDFSILINYVFVYLSSSLYFFYSLKLSFILSIFCRLSVYFSRLLFLFFVFAKIVIKL